MAVVEYPDNVLAKTPTRTKSSSAAIRLRDHFSLLLSVLYFATD
jgi:hypothetical protein